MELTLEIVEGPDAGRQTPLNGPLVLGRDPTADVVLDDSQASRRHARLTPGPVGAVVEDLESTNGTFVNHNEVHGRAELNPGDELLIGVTLMQLRSARQVAAQPSAVRAIPPALAAQERRPTFVDPVVRGKGAPPSGVPELDRLVDSRTKSKAKLAPFAVLSLAALIVVIYLGLN